MRISKSALLTLALSAALVMGPALDCAWAKDGSNGREGSSGKASGGSSGKGNLGSGGRRGSLNTGSISQSFEGSPVQRTKRKPIIGGAKLTDSTSELHADLARAQKALQEAELKFNRGLADPKANLKMLEQAIRNAETAIAAAGARPANASGQ